MGLQVTAFSLYLHMVLSVYTPMVSFFRFQISSPYKGIGQIGLGPHFNLTASLKILSSSTSHILRCWGLVRQHMNFGEDTVEPLTAHQPLIHGTVAILCAVGKCWVS